MKTILVAAFVAVSSAAGAQVVTDPPKDVSPKVAPPKKAEARKLTARKPAPTKPVAPTKPAAPKKPAAPNPSSGPPNVTVYRNDRKPPVLRDKGGNAIPTSPDAYDVSSAVGKK